LPSFSALSTTNVRCPAEAFTVKTPPTAIKVLLRLLSSLNPLFLYNPLAPALRFIVSIAERLVPFDDHEMISSEENKDKKSFTGKLKPSFKNFSLSFHQYSSVYNNCRQSLKNTILQS